MQKMTTTWTIMALVLTLHVLDGWQSLTYAQASLVRKPVQELAETISRTILKSGGRNAAEKLAAIGGEVGVRRIVERALREGGEDTVNTLVRLSREHGVSALHAADNAVNIPRLVMAVDELPRTAVGSALRRLGAGAEGQALARIVDRHGIAALRAEVAHPGIGGRLVSTLGTDSAPLVGRLSTDHAVGLARHADDIHRLPATQQDGVLRILRQDAERMAAFMGRFLERNPGIVLFTGAATTIILANSERILGGDDLVFDGEGNPVLLPRQGTVERILAPTVNTVLWFVLPLLSLGTTIWLAVKIWYLWQFYRLRLESDRKKFLHAGMNNKGS